MKYRMGTEMKCESMRKKDRQMMIIMVSLREI